MAVKLNLELIKARACEKHRRIMNLIELLSDATTDDIVNTIVAKSLGAELCSSIQATEDLYELQNEAPYYSYDKYGTCSFTVDNIIFEVADLRNMRKIPGHDFEAYYDICILLCSYKNLDGNISYHVVPNSLLYGSTSDSFKAYRPVDSAFLHAAKEYIEANNITPDMQKED